MGLMYSSVFQAIAITAQEDLFELQPADDKPVTLYTMLITQETEIGDAQEEFIRNDIVRGNTTSGSGGSTATPRATDRNNSQAAGATVEINNTTKATTAGTFQDTQTWNERSGLVYIPIPEVRITASQADTTICPARMVTTPADSVTMDGVIYHEEN